ncbi:Protein kinase-like domain protein [Niveomyces insectorum RCEF 264]|uniref:Protein kinase-like domain protein n=1 Tax=Niveomyces insectorum RCEF 264 TaxID=1081102 RepID=A0A167X5W2_9HYPO|nr:Protein kinase-like domain protein [Niveomyces insectorum RCEF 264]
MPSSAIQEHVYVDLTKLEFLAAGKSGMVYATDDGRVLKQYYEHETDGVLMERQVFQRLGSHPNIIQYLGATKDGHTVLERGISLRSLYQQQRGENIPFDQKARWVREAASGLDHLHGNNVLHADVGCHNMVLVEDHVKLIDFEGCSIDGSEATSCYEWFSYRKERPEVSVHTDIFAFGCAIYELVAGHHPYHELATEENRTPKDLVESRYSSKQFPDTMNLPFGTTIYSCWTGEFDSMRDVIAALDSTSVLHVGSRGTILGAFSAIGAGITGLKAFLFHLLYSVN